MAERMHLTESGRNLLETLRYGNVYNSLADPQAYINWVIGFSSELDVAPSLQEVIESWQRRAEEQRLDLAAFDTSTPPSKPQVRARESHQRDMLQQWRQQLGALTPAQQTAYWHGFHDLSGGFYLVMDKARACALYIRFHCTVPEGWGDMLLEFGRSEVDDFAKIHPEYSTKQLVVANTAGQIKLLTWFRARGAYPWLSRQQNGDAQRLLDMLLNGANDTFAGKRLLAQCYLRSSLGDARKVTRVQEWLQYIDSLEHRVRSFALSKSSRHFTFDLGPYMLCQNVQRGVDRNFSRYFAHVSPSHIEPNHCETGIGTANQSWQQQGRRMGGPQQGSAPAELCITKGNASRLIQLFLIQEARGSHFLREHVSAHGFVVREWQPYDFEENPMDRGMMTLYDKRAWREVVGRVYCCRTAIALQLYNEASGRTMTFVNVYMRPQKAGWVEGYTVDRVSDRRIAAKDTQGIKRGVVGKKIEDLLRQDLESVLDKVATWGPRIVVAGDFNAMLVFHTADKLHDVIANSRGKWLWPQMIGRKFHLLNGTCPENNSGFTFKGTFGKSTPDLVWLSEDLWAVAQCQGVPAGELLQIGDVQGDLSDHAPLKLHIPLFSTNPSIPLRGRGIDNTGEKPKAS